MTQRTSPKYLRRKDHLHQEAYTLSSATEPADFFKEYWQTQEYVGVHQFEDYNDWFFEDHNVYDADQDDSA